VNLHLILKRVFAYGIDILLLFVVLAPAVTLAEWLFHIKPQTPLQVWIATAFSFSICCAGSFYLALVTGRSLPSILPLIDEGSLPQPNFICSDVGTELLVPGDSENALGRKFTAQVSPTWDLEALYSLGEGQGVWRQDFPEGQPRFQAGFDWDGQQQTLAAFSSRVAQFPDVYILPSYQRYIDVLPLSLGKGKVVQFLQRELGLDPARVVVAGDAGNDRQMFDAEFKGILPANARPELQAFACASWHYHSPFPAARGVLDGLEYFGLIRR
jgi:hydroxymethylpyrimidine pyrophosphatase-like HAD family hydrolase